MGKLPGEWQRVSTSYELDVYERPPYQIYLWKRRKEKRYTVEAFRQLTGYKRRLLSRDFKSLKDARAFVRRLMKQKEIRGYYV